MLQVVLSYEFIGVKIFGIVSDAGGRNTKMFKLLQGHHEIKGPWPSAECLSFANPVDLNRSIYIWSCGTHNFKALRNNIWKSQLSKSKSFLKCGTPFGWNEIECTYLRDKGRIEKGLPQRTDLTKHSVYLDNFTKMNVSYVKKCFSEKTISEMLAYVGDELDVKFDIGKKFGSQWHKFMSYCVDLKSKISSNTTLQCKGYIAMLEYQIAVHGIYIERFINKEWQLNRDNIDSEKEVLTHAIRYFTEWKAQRGHVISSMNLTKRDTEKYFMADITYHNLLQCIGGFFAYSKAVLSASDPTSLWYVPGLHSNQSSLENFFSRMRQLDEDRTDVYAGGVLQ